MSKAQHAFVRPIARFGYAARGLTYLIVGILICVAAFSTGEEVGVRDALSSLTGQWWGTALLWIIVVGFGGYVFWRLIQSLLDTDHHGWTPKGLGVRLGLLASAATYTTLGIFILGLLGVFGGSSSRRGDEQGPVLSFFADLFGSGIINLGGMVIFAIVAGAHIYKAVMRRYARHFQCDDARMAFVHPVSIIGLMARGLVFTIISFLFGYRWWTGRGSENDTPSLTDAMDWVRGWSFGEYVYLAFGIGLICFALYSIAEAAWRRINVEDASPPGDQSAD